VNGLEEISRMSEVAATLGNESRLILLRLVAGGEKSVDALAELSGIPVASTSQHLQVLKKSNMVVTRREGKRVLYRLQDGPIGELIDALERFAVFRDLGSGAHADAAEGITPGQLEKRLKTGRIMLIDVRSRDEFNKEHISGAVNLPFEELKKRVSKIPGDRDLIVYCRGPYCLLSVNAVALLRANGVPAVRLTSGLSGWQGAREGMDRGR
jgi:rhodanese-related sulfurtransferase/DNA-binding transcriptional ArsR family regulator